MKTFESRRKLRTQRDISARQHDRVSRDLEYVNTELTRAQQIAWDWKDQHDQLLKTLPTLRAETARADEAEKARDEALALAMEYQQILEQKYGWAPPNEPEWADAPDPDDQPDAASNLPAWNDITGMFGVVDLDAEPESFTTYITRIRESDLSQDQIDAALKKPRRTRRTVVPAQRDSSKS